ncbi:MAG: putative molybdenum carrier protein [Deltaproteobacteria bacterium]
MMIEKIISGALNSVEIAALDSAIRLGIPYAGFRPGIEVPEPSTLVKKYKIATLDSNQPKDAIEANVKQADGTFILSMGRLEDHGDFARHMTLKNRKHLLGMDLSQHPPFKAAGLLASWLDMNHIRFLYVTGAFDEKEPDIRRHTLNILESAFISLLAGPSLPYIKKRRFRIDGELVFRGTATANEAVKLLMTSLPLKDKAAIAAANPETLCRPGNNFNRYLQDVFHLREGNEALLQSCAKHIQKEEITAAEASGVIIRLFWEALQKTYRLRVVK